MRDWPLLSFFAITFFLLFAVTVIRYLRTFFRARMISFLLNAVGGVILVGGCIGLVVSMIKYSHLLRQGELNFWIIIFFVFVIIGGSIDLIGRTIYLTTESGTWKEICDKTSFWQRMTGNIPVIERKKYPDAISKKLLLFIGSSLIAIGVLSIISLFFFNISTNSNSVFIGLIVVSLISVTEGILLVVFSLAYLNRNKE